LTGPAIAAAIDLGPIDAVLVSHDHHGDNLDTAGRALLPGAGVVLTTAARGQAPGRLGEGSTVVANAERVKDAAEAYRYGYLLVYDLKRSPTAWGARWHNGGCRPVEGRRRRPPASFRSGHCVDRRPHQQRRSS
jgi:hypothetical protein